MGEFIIYHRLRPKSGGSHEVSGLEFSTCLRQLIFVQEPLLGKDQDQFLECGFEVYRGEGAYGFLLEVVCGLRSPILGETEVMGQFKSWLELHEPQLLPSVRKKMQLLITDAKCIRNKFLQNIGCHSYGSLVRKYLDPQTEVHILGAGQLAQEILPWISKPAKEITLYCRNPKKLPEDLQGISRKIDMIQPSAQGLVVVAAPLSANYLQSWLAETQVQLVLDLRGESDSDPIKASFNVVPLSRFFSTIEKNKSKNKILLQQILQEIQLRSVKLTNYIQVRPFGWEDLCG